MTTPVDQARLSRSILTATMLTILVVICLLAPLPAAWMAAGLGVVLSWLATDSGQPRRNWLLILVSVFFPVLPVLRVLLTA